MPTGTERILFVDDEKPLTIISKRMLEGLGYAVSAKTDSLEALEEFRTDPHGYDLVVTDMTMPGMTGDRLAREMINIRSDIPVVLCTGYSESITPESVRAIGIRELIHALEDCISRARYEPTLFPQHLPDRIRIHVARSSIDTPPDQEPAVGEFDNLAAIPTYRDFRNTAIANLGKKYFQRLIKFTPGDIHKACQISGLGRSRLYALLKKHNLSRTGRHST